MRLLPEEFVLPPTTWYEACVYATYNLTKDQLNTILNRYSHDTEVCAALTRNGYYAAVKPPLIGFTFECLGDFEASLYTDSIDLRISTLLSHCNYKSARLTYSLIGLLSRRDLTSDHIKQILCISSPSKYENAVIAAVMLLHPSCSDELKLELTLKYG